MTYQALPTGTTPTTYDSQYQMVVGAVNQVFRNLNAPGDKSLLGPELNRMLGVPPGTQVTLNVLLADPRFLTNLKNRYGFASSYNYDDWGGQLAANQAASAAIGGLGGSWMLQYTTPAVTLGWRGLEFSQP